MFLPEALTPGEAIIFLLALSIIYSVGRRILGRFISHYRRSRND